LALSKRPYKDESHQRKARASRMFYQVSTCHGTDMDRVVHRSQASSETPMVVTQIIWSIVPKFPLKFHRPFGLQLSDATEPTGIASVHRTNPVLPTFTPAKDRL
jgi:hypothetical protein